MFIMQSPTVANSLDVRKREWLLMRTIQTTSLNKMCLKCKSQLLQQVKVKPADVEDFRVGQFY